MTNEFIRGFIYGIFSILNMVFPKKNQIFIYGERVLNGNSEAILYYLTHARQYKCLCMTDNHREYNNSLVSFIPCSKIGALKNMISSKVVLDSSMHSIKMHPTKRQAIIQMWHGSPLKYLAPPKKTVNAKYYTHIFYSSDLFKDSLQYVFRAKDEQMFLNGSPCNDYFFGRHQKIDIIQAKKNIIWLPTYRQWTGRLNLTRIFPILEYNNIDELNSFLNEKDITLFIKMHSLQSVPLPFMDRIGNNNRIQIIDDDFLLQHKTVLYEFLLEMDALITDYSSVSFDFMLLNKPIAYTIDDIEEYTDEVGFNFDNPFYYMPGEKITTFNQLKKFIEDISTNSDPYMEERKIICNEVHHYQDGKCHVRCINLIDKYMSK